MRPNRFASLLTLSVASLALASCGKDSKDNNNSPKNDNFRLLNGVGSLQNNRDRAGFEKGRSDVYGVTKDTKSRLVSSGGASLGLSLYATSPGFPNDSEQGCDMRMGADVVKVTLERNCTDASLPAPFGQKCQLRSDEASDLLELDSTACRSATEDCAVSTPFARDEETGYILLKSTCKALSLATPVEPNEPDVPVNPEQPSEPTGTTSRAENSDVDFGSLDLMGQGEGAGIGIMNSLIQISEQGEGREFACSEVSTSLDTMYGQWAEKAKALYGLVTAEKQALAQTLGNDQVSGAASFQINEVKGSKHAVEYSFAPNAGDGNRDQETFAKTMSMSGNVFGGGTEGQLYAGLSTSISFKFKEFMNAFSEVTSGGAVMPGEMMDAMPDEMSSENLFVVMTELASKTIRSEERGSFTWKGSQFSQSGTVEGAFTLQGGDAPELVSTVKISANGDAPEGKLSVALTLSSTVAQRNATTTTFNFSMGGNANGKPAAGELKFNLVRFGAGRCKIDGLKQNLPKEVMR